MSRVALIFHDPAHLAVLRRCSAVAKSAGFDVPDDPDCWRRERGAWWFEGTNVIAYVEQDGDQWRGTVTLKV